MGKILLLVLVAVTAYLIIRSYRRSLSSSTEVDKENSLPETMVKCAHCGVNLPRSEAIYAQDAFYCTPEHQKLGKS